jgi:hypothetical protein
MRNPKVPGRKGPAAETPPAGGRAWARTQQFATARGLPLQITPEAKKSTQAVASTAKPATKRATKPPAKRSSKARAR